MSNWGGTSSQINTLSGLFREVYSDQLLNLSSYTPIILSTEHGITFQQGNSPNVRYGYIDTGLYADGYKDFYK